MKAITINILDGILDFLKTAKSLILLSFVIFEMFGAWFAVHSLDLKNNLYGEIMNEYSVELAPTFLNNYHVNDSSNPALIELQKRDFSALKMPKKAENKKKIKRIVILASPKLEDHIDIKTDTVSKRNWPDTLRYVPKIKITKSPPQ